MPSRTASKVAEQHAKRLRIVALHEQGCLTVKEIAHQAGVSTPTVRSTLRRHAESGVDGLAPEPRGRATGQGRVLSPAQELHLRTALLSQHPAELGISATAWTRAAVLTLVNRVMAEGRGPSRGPMSSRTLGDYLRRWGFTAGGVVASTASQAAAPFPHVRLSAGQTRQMVLWELLGWLPVTDARMHALAGALSGLRWDGYVLFVSLNKARTFQREVSALRARFEAHAARQERSPASKTAIAARTTQGELIAAHWDEAERAARVARMAGMSGACLAWSLRIFPVSMLVVSPARTAHRHVGPTTVGHQPVPGLFVGAVHLVSGAVKATILRTAKDEDGGVFAAEAELQRFLARIAQTGSTPRLHLPIDHQRYAHYAMAVSCAARLGLEAVGDMLPAYFVAGAHAAVDVLHLARRENARTGTRASVRSVQRESWDEPARPDGPELPSGPIPGNAQADIPGANRRPRPAEAKLDKA